ncbi:hypothetical protein [Roseovarius aestuarii]|uniref:Uncharacterized protein n=1 Tax=Roseovarius aestuarii TaxID=475083 RepID=A0A1X7BSB2_9RHOB|nr:hypothetical protein [Roseovarius aestuarii]SMC12497.1 hypothetical protein ROA7745_02323 [Roseovarius aestuarii]
MTSYNVNFELSVEDVELIEAALQNSGQDLSSRLVSSEKRQNETFRPGQDCDETLRQIQDLLGRLHNQKVFYRPRAGAYIGG